MGVQLNHAERVHNSMVKWNVNGERARNSMVNAMVNELINEF